MLNAGTGQHPLFSAWMSWYVDANPTAAAGGETGAEPKDGLLSPYAAMWPRIGSGHQSILDRLASSPSS